MLLLSATMINAQNCKCNPHGFNPFQYTYNGETQTVRSMHQFDVKCNTPILLNGGYKCSYKTVCDVKLKATIKKNDASGSIIKSYDDFTFPWKYEFENAGSYVLEITPWCGGKVCAAAKFYFTVTCDKPTVCKCRGKDGWNKFTAYIDGAAKPTNCGESFQIGLKQQFGLEGGYKCEGNCNVALKGQIVNTTTGESQSFPNVNLSGIINFPSAGDYKLILTPTCAKEECDVCIFYVTVKK